MHKDLRSWTVNCRCLLFPHYPPFPIPQPVMPACELICALSEMMVAVVVHPQMFGRTDFHSSPQWDPDRPNLLH